MKVELEKWGKRNQESHQKLFKVIDKKFPIQNDRIENNLNIFLVDAGISLKNTGKPTYYKLCKLKEYNVKHHLLFHNIYIELFVFVFLLSEYF